MDFSENYLKETTLHVFLFISFYYIVGGKISVLILAYGRICDFPGLLSSVKLLESPVGFCCLLTQ